MYVGVGEKPERVWRGVIYECSFAKEHNLPLKTQNKEGKMLLWRLLQE